MTLLNEQLRRITRQSLATGIHIPVSCAPNLPNSVTASEHGNVTRKLMRTDLTKLAKAGMFDTVSLILVNSTTTGKGHMWDWMFLLVTAFVAYHALTHRNDDGENDIGHMLFGAIAALFFMRVLLVDILKVW